MSLEFAIAMTAMVGLFDAGLTPLHLYPRNMYTQLTSLPAPASHLGVFSPGSNQDPHVWLLGGKWWLAVATQAGAAITALVSIPRTATPAQPPAARHQSLDQLGRVVNNLQKLTLCFVQLLCSDPLQQSQ